MIGKLIRTDDETTVLWDKFPDSDALAAENERAQAVTDGQLSWVECTPYELGVLTAHIACAMNAFGGSDGDGQKR